FFEARHYFTSLLKTVIKQEELSPISKMKLVLKITGIVILPRLTVSSKD
ncbi:hypothetical protein TNCV_632971, partial [Trichonephila clavipes]